MNIYDLLNKIGNYFPIILFICSVYTLYSKTNYLYFYILGYILDSCINKIFKNIFKTPIPLEDEKKINLLIKNKQNIILKNNKILSEKFGMPSKNVESVMYSLTYIYLSTEKKYYLLFYSSILLYVIWRDLYYNYHNISQIIIGIIVGLIIAIFIYKISKNNLFSMKIKDDDNCKI